jgi:hypothetical protein
MFWANDKHFSAAIKEPFSFSRSNFTAADNDTNLPPNVQKNRIIFQDLPSCRDIFTLPKPD